MSRPSTFLDFPESEYRRRYDAAKKLMQEKNIDALLLTGKENLIYFTGYRTELYASKFRPFIGILPLDKDPVMLVPDLELFGCTQTTWIKDVRHWGFFLNAAEKDAIALTVKTLRELNLDKGRLGMELGLGQRLGMSIQEFQRLSSDLPEAKFLDVTEILWRIRAVKSGEEITRIRKACQITEKAIEAGWGLLREGVTERELAQEIQTTMIEEGADRLGFLVIRSGFARLNMLNPLPSDYRLQRGDMITLDLGSVYRDYWSDMVRNAIIGAPTERAKEIYEVVIKAQQNAMETVRPGVKASDVDAAATKVLREAGYEKWMLHRTGHGVGLEVHEMPALSAADQTVLEPNMVLTIEPGLYPLAYSGELGNFLVEDMVLVTKNGYEKLTSTSGELYISS